MKRIWAVLALCAALSGCSAMQGVDTAAGLIGGAAGSSTPSVDATAQVGAENTQEGDAVVDTRRVEDRRVDAGVEVSEVSGVSNVTSENINEEQGKDAGVSSRDWTSEVINVQNVPPLFLWLFALGWILPGPVDILRGLGKILIFLRDFFLGI